MTLGRNHAITHKTMGHGEHMKRYSELFKAKAAQEKADFEERRDEDRRLNAVMFEARTLFEAMMISDLQPEFKLRWTRLNLTVVGFSCWRALARRA